MGRWVTCRVVDSDIHRFEESDASWRRSLVVERFGECVVVCSFNSVVLNSPHVG